MNVHHCFPLILSIALITLITSCEDENTIRQVEWEKIEFPNESVVYTIFGNRDAYLLVGTSTKILRSENGGLSWDTVLRVHEPIGDLSLLNNDI